MKRLSSDTLHPTRFAPETKLILRALGDHGAIGEHNARKIDTGGIAGPLIAAGLVAKRTVRVGGIPSTIYWLTPAGEVAWLAAIRESSQKCRHCGCTDSNACITPDGPCYWIADSVCSAPDCARAHANSKEATP